MKNEIDNICIKIKDMDIENLIETINYFKLKLHEISPFKTEPVDCVIWVKNESVVSNDYNPNKVAPPEMELLEISIMNDGYTQPIVTWENDDKGKIEVIDGFHRSRVGKESKLIKQRVHGYLPVVNIRTEQSGKNDRIASTIRHNRARGKHQVNAMSEIVIELKNRNWSNDRIAKQLGMDLEEVLRLCQVSGLEHLFSDSDFSRAWEASDSESLFEPIDDNVSQEEIDMYRIPLEKDDSRIFHTYDKWECHKAGFYASKKDGLSDQDCINEYAKFLNDDSRFRIALQGVLDNWINSCEHYLSNRAMNRIAWLGQASMCYDSGIPSKFCSGFNLLTEEEKDKANNTALEYLNKWMSKYNRPEISLNEALGGGREVSLY